MDNGMPNVEELTLAELLDLRAGGLGMATALKQSADVMLDNAERILDDLSVIDGELRKRLASGSN